MRGCIITKLSLSHELQAQLTLENFSSVTDKMRKLYDLYNGHQNFFFNEFNTISRQRNTKPINKEQNFL